MEQEQLSDNKLYEIAMNNKNHAEDRRDEINKYYPSLFSAIIVVMPFVGKFGSNTDNTMDNSIAIAIALGLLSIVGITISFSWIKTLKRI